MAGDINIKMKLDGESEFRRQIKECNAEMKNMQSALKLVDAEAQGEANSIENLTKKQEALDNVLKAATRKQEEIAEAYQNATKNQQQMADQLEQARELYGENSKEVEKAETAYSNATQKVNDWERQLNNAKVEIIDINTALTENETYMEEARNSADGCATSIDEYGKKTKTATGETDELLNVMSKTAAMEAMKNLADEASAVFQKLGDAAYDAMIEIDAGYDTIITKTGATGDALKGLEESAANVYTNLPTNMDAVGTAIGEVNTRFGMTDTALEHTSELFLKFAEINGTDVNNSIDQVDRILTQYGEDVSDLEGFLGQLTKVSQDTGKSTGDLLSQLDQNAGVLKTFGLGLEESVNLFGKFEDNGIQASTALQGLKKAAAKYASEGDDMRTGLRKTVDVIKNASTETEAYAEAQEVFGARGFTAMADAIRDGRFSIEGLTDDFSNYTDTVTSTYNETKNAWDEWTVAQNNLKVAGGELSNEFYEALTPAIESITGIVQDATEGFRNLPEPMQDVLGIAGGLVTEAGELAPKLFEVGTSLATLQAAKTAADSLSKMSGAATGAATSAGKLSTALSGIGGVATLGAIGAVVGILLVVQQAVKDLNADVDELANDIANRTQESAAAMATYKSAVESAGTGADKFAAAAKGLEAAHDAQSDAVKDASKVYGKYSDVMQTNNKYAARNLGMINSLVYAFDSIQTKTTLEEALENTSESSQEAAGALIEFQNAQRDAVLEMNEGNEATYNATANTVALAESLGRTSGEYENVMESLASLTAAHQEETAQITAEIQGIEAEMQSLQEEYDAAYQSAYDSLSGQFGLFEQVTVEAQTSVEDMNAALESQMQFMTDYATNLQEAAKMGVSEGLIKQLSDGSVESAQYLQAIVDSGGEGIEELNKNFQKVENGKQAMSKIMAENVTDFSNKMSALESRMNTAVDRLNKADAAYVSGAQTIQGYIRGSEAYRSAIIAEYTSLGNAATQAFNAAVKIKSPSRVFYNSGQMTVEGAILGAESMKKNLIDTYESLALASANAFDPAAYTTNISNYAGATTLNNQVAVYIGDKELTGYMANGVIKAISDNARNGYAGRRV